MIIKVENNCTILYILWGQNRGVYVETKILHWLVSTLQKPAGYFGTPGIGVLVYEVFIKTSGIKTTQNVTELEQVEETL